MTAIAEPVAAPVIRVALDPAQVLRDAPAAVDRAAALGLFRGTLSLRLRLRFPDREPAVAVLGDPGSPRYAAAPPEPAVAAMIETLRRADADLWQVARCAWCGALVPAQPDDWTPPPAADEVAWFDLSLDHRARCRWVASRAFRR